MDETTVEKNAPVVPAANVIELRGIDYVPEPERTSKPSNLFWVFVGAQLTFGVMILGWLPIVFGLSVISSMTAVTLGTITGSVFFGLFSLLGPRTGTNSAVSTGAFYGVRGRYLGSLKALFIGIGYLALTVWVSGDIAASGVSRLMGGGSEASAGSRALWYGILMLVLIVIAIYGHDLLVKIQSVFIPVVLIGFALLIASTFGDFVTIAPTVGGGLSSGEAAIAWIASFVIAMQLPISYMPFANGFTRYISKERWGDKRVFWAVAGGMTVGVLIILYMGIYLSSLFASDELVFGDGVVSALPQWVLIPMLIITVLGALDQGGFALYGVGLDSQTTFPGLKRISGTVISSIIALLLVFLGSFVWNAVDTVNTFVTIIALFVLPWFAVSYASFLFQNKRIWALDLQVFAQGIRGGAYWYTRGWNWQAVTSYAIGVAVSLLFMQTEQVSGPLWNLFGGADLTVFISAIIALLAYLVLRKVWPKNLIAPDKNVSDGDASPILHELKVKV